MLAGVSKGCERWDTWSLLQKGLRWTDQGQARDRGTRIDTLPRVPDRSLKWLGSRDFQ